MPIFLDIVTDEGADPTGVASSATAFYVNLKADMAGQDAVVTVPAGDYRFGAASGGLWGMTSLIMNGAGPATTRLYQDTGGTIDLGAIGIPNAGLSAVNGKSARIQTCYPGEISVTLTAASASAGYISRAVVGQWMCVAGFDVQGLFQSAYGFPPNSHFVDFVRITGIVGDTISFNPALTNFYSDQWPCFNEGTAGEVDSGGAATVYFVHENWGATWVYDGLKVQNGDLIKGQGLDFTFQNGSCDGSTASIYPSVNRVWRCLNTDLSTTGQVEIDKLIHHAIFDGGLGHKIHTQSSSVTNLQISNYTMDDAVDGTPRYTTIEDSTIGNLVIGPLAYGRGDAFSAKNVVINGTISSNVLFDTGPASVGWQNVLRMSGGVITMSQAAGAADGYSLGRLWVPHRDGRYRLFWYGNSNNTVGSFAVLAVTADPWPALDDQSSTTNVTMTEGGNSLTTSASLFSSADLYKTITVTGARGAGTLRTFITAYNSPTNVTLQDICTTVGGLTASSQTVQWGTCNMYIQTDQTGGLPDPALYASTNKLGIRALAAKSVSFENCSGSLHAVDLSQVAARDRPLYSYTKRTYDGTTFGATADPITIIGNIVSVKINVTTAYTGVQGTLNVGITQFDNMATVIGGAESGSYSSYGPRVNLKIVGERVITVGSTTGAQSLDTNLNVSVPTWICQGIRPSVSQNITGESASVYPAFTIEIITDQGFPTAPSAVAPLRLRLLNP